MKRKAASVTSRVSKLAKSRVDKQREKGCKPAAQRPAEKVRRKNSKAQKLKTKHSRRDVEAAEPLSAPMFQALRLPIPINTLDEKPLREGKEAKKVDNAARANSAAALRRLYSQIHSDVEPRLQDKKYVFTAVCPQAKVIREGLKCASKLFRGPVPVIIAQQGVFFDGSAPLQKHKEEGALVSASILTGETQFVKYNYRSPRPYLRFVFGNDIVQKHTCDGQNQLLLWFLELDPVRLYIQLWGYSADIYDEVVCEPIEHNIPLWIPERTTVAEDCRAVQICLSTFLTKAYVAKFRNEIAPLTIEVHENCIMVKQKQGKRRINVNPYTEEGDKLKPLTAPIIINTCTYAFYQVVKAFSDYNKNALMILDPKKPNRIIFTTPIQEFASGARVCLDVNRNLALTDDVLKE